MFGAGVLAWLLLSQNAAAPADRPVTDLTTEQLASRLFDTPPADIVSHRVFRDSPFPGNYSIRFYSRVEPFGDGLCRRHGYYIGMSDDHPRGAPVPQEELAIAQDCALVPADGFAHVQPAAALDAAATTLRWLKDRQRRGGAERILCRHSQFAPNPCARGAAHTLKALPLDRIFVVDRGQAPGAWNIAVMPEGPGQLFYDVTLERGDRSEPVITIEWKAPAPF